jgi:hypothetical protein
VNKKQLIKLGIDIILLLLLIIFSWKKALEYSKLDTNYIPVSIFYIIIICGLIFLEKGNKISLKIENIFEKLKVIIWVYRLLFLISIFANISGSRPTLLFISYWLQIAVIAGDLKIIITDSKKEVK